MNGAYVELVKRWSRECWRCGLEILEPERLNSHCPRCAVDLDSLVDLGADSDQGERKSWQAAIDLTKIYENWTSAYKRLLAERQEADYSLLDDFATEVMEFSFPYMSRLVKQGILRSDALEYVKNRLNALTLDLHDTIVLYEDIQKLQGSWTDDDQENKEYWLKRLRWTGKTLSTLRATQEALPETT